MVDFSFFKSRTFAGANAVAIVIDGSEITHRFPWMSVRIQA